MRPVISACIIVKDDSEIVELTRSTKSIEPYVSGIYITANGEKTEAIESLCKQNNYHYSYLKWDNDFSKQRNFNFLQAPKNTDYIYWQDADDVLVGAEYLEEIALKSKQTNKEVVFFTYWYGCVFNGEPSEKNLVKVDIQHMRERLIKPGSIVWKGRLHETPVKVEGARDVYVKFPYNKDTSPIAVMHTKKYETATKTMERNKAILEMQLEEERNGIGADPRTILNLMKIYTELEDEKILEKCIYMGKEYLEKSGWDMERGVCYSLMAIAFMKLNENQASVDLLHRAIQEYPQDPLQYIRLAMAYYNIGKKDRAKHWVELALKMDINESGSGIVLTQEMKVLASDLLSRLKLDQNDIDSAYEFSKILYNEMPTQINEDRLATLESMKRMNDACKNVHSFLIYLEDTNQTSVIPQVIDNLPQSMQGLPFAVKYKQLFTKPKKWESNEICIYANFGSKHFEQWSPSSLKKGIGGSETAVIELAELWASMGYEVTVYGDPGAEEGLINGVTYLPWYKFNIQDSFNIFIQWRAVFLADKIKAKRFYVDLHDIYNPIDLIEAEPHVDAFMFKSQYHADLTSAIPVNKKLIIGNGISYEE